MTTDEYQDIEFKNFLKLKENYEFIKSLSDYTHIVELKEEWFITQPPIVPLVLQNKEGQHITIHCKPGQARFVYYYFDVPEPIHLMRYFNLP